MSTAKLKTVILRNDDKFVDEENQEIPIDSIIHCLGSLFKLTNSGLSHVVGKIDDNTYFADPKFFCQLNELAFSEQTDVTSTPDAAPQREGLLASAYRLMTAPFSMRTPKNVTTRTRKRKSSLTKLVSITETTGVATQAEDHNNSMNIPQLSEILLLNARCEKGIAEEVQFYFKSYQEFVTSNSQKLIAVISALNVANIGCYNDLIIKYPGFISESPVVNINKLASVIQSVYPTQVLQYLLGDRIKENPTASKATVNEDVNNVGLFPPKGKDQERLFPQNSSPKNEGNINKHLGKLNMDQSVEEINEEINERGSYQPPDRQNISHRSRSRSPESVTQRENYRCDVTDRRYRYDNYANRPVSSDNSQLTASQQMEAKLFLDKIVYFNGSNNKEALNYLAQCEEAAEKMKAPKTMVTWSKLAGRADVVMREESRQHEGIVTWEVFQSMLIEHFYHIPSKERAAKLLNKLQQDPHESIGEYVQ